MLIYVTGTIGAGKGEVVEYLKKKYGMKHYSFRQYYTDELKRRNQPVDRPHMIDLADSLRQTYGNDYVVGELTGEARHGKSDAVIESIRNLGEVAYLKAQGDAVLLAVDAPKEIRFKRINDRGSALDDRTMEQFLADDERENVNADEWRTNILACIKQADFVYNNVGSIEDLHAWIDKIMRNVSHGSKSQKRK